MTKQLIKIFMCVIFLYGAKAQVYGQESETLSFSLEQAREYAINNNLEIKNADLDIRISQKKVWETTSSGLPQLNGSIEYNNFLDIATQLIPAQFFDPNAEPGEMAEVQFGTKHSATYGVTVSQLIFSGSYFVGLQTSKIYNQLSIQNKEKTVETIIETVNQTYYTILIAEESKKILDSTLINLNKTYFEITELNKEGFVEETDIDQMKLNVENLKNIISSLERQIDVAYLLLKYQMNIDNKKTITLSENLDIIISSINFDVLAVQKFDIGKNSDYKLVSTQELLSMKNLKNERSKYYPTVSGFYSYQRNAQRNKFNFFDGSEPWFPTSIIGLKAEIPIFSSGMRCSRVQQAKMELQKVQNSKSMIEEALIMQSEQARKELLNSLEMYKSDIDNVKISKKIYDRMLIKYKEGLSGSTDLITIHNQYLNSQSNYINSLSGLLNSKNQLDKILNNF